MSRIPTETDELSVYLPDTRGVSISRFGKGNFKLGPNVFTFSRMPGSTCPGKTDWCEAVCYAERVVGEDTNPVAGVWRLNSYYDDVPPELPKGCQLLRLHVGGDFSSRVYIQEWIRVLSRPEYRDVKVWAYTRSWRLPRLLESLEALRALPNVQLFASMDPSTTDMPPDGWRVAWIEGDPRAASAKSLPCPEQRGVSPNCETCRYCFLDGRKDVTFSEH